MFRSKSSVASLFPLVEGEGLGTCVDKGDTSLIGVASRATVVMAALPGVTSVVRFAFFLDTVVLSRVSVAGMSDEAGRRRIFRRNRDIQAIIPG